jgi:hypothetical protein
MDLRGMWWWEGVGWMNLTQERDQWRVVNVVMNLPIHERQEIF